MARAREFLAVACLLILTGCATPLDGQPHPDFNTELLLQVLNDVDYVMTNYAWLLALLGL